MVRWVVGSSLKFRLLVVPLDAALIFAGVMQLRKAPVDVLPEYTLPAVEVQTESLGLSAPEVEQLITVPMEQDLLNGVMGVDTIRSDSVPGLSDITMIFERGTSIFQARQLVQERLTQAHAQPVSPLTFVEASTPGTGGFLDGPNQRLGIRHIVPFGKPANLGQVPIEGTNGALRLGDVASVTEDHQPLIGDAVVGNHHGLLLVVQKLSGANTLKVTHEVENALDELRPGLAGVQIDSHVFRPASFIEDAMGNMATLLIIGGALLALALAAFFLQWRAVLVSVIAIPVSLVTALPVLREP